MKITLKKSIILIASIIGVVILCCLHSKQLKKANKKFAIEQAGIEQNRIYGCCE